MRNNASAAVSASHRLVQPGLPSEGEDLRHYRQTISRYLGSAVGSDRLQPHTSFTTIVPPQFLVELGIDTVSVTPDPLPKTKRAIAEVKKSIAERKSVKATAWICSWLSFMRRWLARIIAVVSLGLINLLALADLVFVFFTCASSFGSLVDKSLEPAPVPTPEFQTRAAKVALIIFKRIAANTSGSCSLLAAIS